MPSTGPDPTDPKVAEGLAAHLWYGNRPEHVGPPVDPNDLYSVSVDEQLDYDEADPDIDIAGEDDLSWVDMNAGMVLDLSGHE